MALCGRGGGRCVPAGGGARRPGPERQLGVLRPPAFGLWPEARPRVFPGWQTAPGGGQVAVWPCAGAVEAGVPSLRLLSVEAPGARAQRGSWASCAPQALASGPKHGQGCSQGGRWRQVGLRWAFRLVPARWGACAGTSALLPVEARPLRGSWASCAPQALASGPKHGQGSPAKEQKGFLRFHKTTATPGVRKASPPGPPRAVCRRPWLSRRFRQTVPVVADATDKTQIQVKSAGAQ